jgi:hypothetical protein
VPLKEGGIKKDDDEAGEAVVALAFIQLIVIPDQEPPRPTHVIHGRGCRFRLGHNLGDFSSSLCRYLGRLLGGVID